MFYITGAAAFRQLLKVGDENVEIPDGWYSLFLLQAERNGKEMREKETR
jgi:hypothetical protein